MTFPRKKTTLFVWARNSKKIWRKVFLNAFSDGIIRSLNMTSKWPLLLLVWWVRENLFGFSYSWHKYPSSWQSRVADVNIVLTRMKREWKNQFTPYSPLSSSTLWLWYMHTNMIGNGKISASFQVMIRVSFKPISFLSWCIVRINNSERTSLCGLG